MDNPILNSPEAVADFWRAHVVKASWFTPDKECSCVFTLNTRRRLISFALMSIGTLDTILVHPRDAFRLAAVQNASAVILAHNHPSGDPGPSEGDIKVTRDMIRVGLILRIELLDHIIMGSPQLEKDYASLREFGYFDLDSPVIKRRGESPFPLGPTCDKQLVERAAGWSKSKRRRVARTLARWSEQLIELSKAKAGGPAKQAAA